MIILTIDLGTSATKAALWDESGLVALSRTSLTTTHPRPGWAEQNPDEWWNALVDACMQLRDEAAAYRLARGAQKRVDRSNTTERFPRTIGALRRLVGSMA